MNNAKKKVGLMPGEPEPDDSDSENEEEEEVEKTPAKPNDQNGG
jgi:hypothetical protein